MEPAPLRRDADARGVFCWCLLDQVHIAMTDLVLSSVEEKMLQGLLDPKARIELVIPETFGPTELWENLQLCGKAIGYLERTATRLKPVLGRILLLIQQHPESYNNRGYTSFDTFVIDELCGKMGVSRAYVYEAKMLAVKWPRLSIAHFEQIGSRKLALLSRFTDQSQSGHTKWLKEAERHTLTELREIAETQKLITKGEDRPAVIVISTTADVVSEWQRWCANENVQKSAESDNAGMILMRMMQEITGDWGYAEEDDEVF